MIAGFTGGKIFTSWHSQREPRIEHGWHAAHPASSSSTPMNSFASSREARVHAVDPHVDREFLGAAERQEDGYLIRGGRKESRCRRCSFNCSIEPSWLQRPSELITQARAATRAETLGRFCEWRPPPTHERLSSASSHSSRRGCLHNGTHGFVGPGQYWLRQSATPNALEPVKWIMRVVEPLSSATVSGGSVARRECGTRHTCRGPVRSIRAGAASTFSPPR